MPVYVNEWQNKVKQEYNCLALLYFAIHLHIPASILCTVLSVQLSCFTLFCHSFTYTGIMSLDCFVSTTVLLYFILPFITKRFREMMPVYVNEWQNKVKQDSCTDKTVKRQDAGICK
jgi:accessory gene regulator protein AgrB